MVVEMSKLVLNESLTLLIKVIQKMSCLNMPALSYNV